MVYSGILYSSSYISMQCIINGICIKNGKTMNPSLCLCCLVQLLVSDCMYLCVTDGIRTRNPGVSAHRHTS